MKSLPPWILLAAVAVLSAVVFARFPRNEIDVEFYPCFAESVAGGWRCLISMDRLQHPDAVMAYGSWPPGYAFGLGLLGKAGLSYALAVQFWNALILLAGGWFMHGLCRRLGWGHGWPAVGFVLLSPASWLTGTMAFPHIFTVAVMTGMLWSASCVLSGPWTRRAALGWGLGAGLAGAWCHWVAFFVMPALLISWGLVGGWRGPWPLGLRWWLAGCAAGLAAGLLVLLGLQLWVLRDPAVLTVPGAGLVDRIRLRVLPGIRGMAGSLFFGVVRFLVAGGLVVVPLAWWLRGRVRERMSRGQAVALLSLLLAAVGFSVGLSGETGVPTHIFHGRLFVPFLALAFLAVWMAGGRVLRIGMASGVAMLTGLAVAGEDLLPDRMVTSPLLDRLEPGFQGPVEQVAALPVTSEVSGSSLARTVVKQAVALSLPELASRGIENRGKTHAWLQDHRDFLQSATTSGDILVGWHAMSVTAPWELDRCVTGAADSGQLRPLVAGLRDRLPAGRVVVAVPAGFPAATVALHLGLPADALAEAGSTPDLRLFRIIGP